jgi:hypothetical protein
VGRAQGSAIIFAGTLCARFLAKFVHWFVWQGKVFDPKAECLKNLVTGFRILAIKAKVYTGDSWKDGKECIVIDYSKTSLVARMVRDEIREVQPGPYLGKVFLWKKHVADFTVAPVPSPINLSDWYARCKFGTVLAVLILAACLMCRLSIDEPVTYADPIEHFKYGSTGGERSAGIPYEVWLALPEMFPEYLPAGGKEKSFASLGFLYEDGRDLPVGVSQRNYQGLPRVYLNCAICHCGVVRDGPDGEPQVHAGMPSNTVNLQGFSEFLFQVVVDERFTGEQVVAAIDRRGGELDLINRLALRFVGITLMREQLMRFRQRLSTMADREPTFGPGRYDTFNPNKALLNFPLDQLPEKEWIGVVDFPSIWLQGQREEMHMQLHWDGNNTSVDERNRNAAFGTGARPPTLDRPSLARTRKWLETHEPPAYPFGLNQELADKGKPIYGKYCAECHGQNGRDFTADRVGTVVPIEDIGTDRKRLDSYTYQLCVAQSQQYAGYPDRFKHFRKTFGYANHPLDGIWLRAPYLHNGSVPIIARSAEPRLRAAGNVLPGRHCLRPGPSWFRVRCHGTEWQGLLRVRHQPGWQPQHWSRRARVWNGAV